MTYPSEPLCCPTCDTPPRLEFEDYILVRCDLCAFQIYRFDLPESWLTIWAMSSAYGDYYGIYAVDDYL